MPHQSEISPFDPPIDGELVSPVESLIRLDGAVENAMSGVGNPDHDVSAHNAPSSTTKRLTERAKERVYETSWICRRICDAYPSEATRKWLTPTLGSSPDSDAIAKFQKYQRRLKVAANFKRAQTWANIYKGAAIILHVDDGRPSSEPINRDGIRSILSIEALDCTYIRPNTTITFNPLEPDFYELVSLTRLSARQKRTLLGSGEVSLPDLKFHPDRVIRFDGFELPPRVMEVNENWGGSLIDNIWDSFSRYDVGIQSVSSMMQDFNVFIYALQGLGKLLGSEKESDILKLKNRLKSLRLTLSNLKGLVLDKDGESASFVSRNFSGLADILDRLRDDIVGASGLPHTTVFGESPSGMGGTGESEEKTWAKMVNQFQESVFRSKVEQIAELIWLAKDGPTKGKMPEDADFEFNPLLEQTEEEKLATRTSQSTVDNTYVAMGVLLKDEVRASRFGGSSYSIETTLDDAAWQKAQAANEFQFGGLTDANGNPIDPNAQVQDPNVDANGNPIDPNAQAQKTDSADARKRVEKINGIPLDITHDKGDLRHNRVMPMAYGRIRGSYGHAEDGRSWDVLIGPSSDSSKIFKVAQVDPDTLFHDETKYIFNCKDIEEARSLTLATMGRARFGGIQEAGAEELAQYRTERTDGRRRTSGRISGRLPRTKKTKTATTASREDASDGPDLAEMIADRSVADINKAIKEWRQQISVWLKAQAAAGATLPEIRDRLPELYNQLNAKPFAKALNQSMQLGYLGGRAEILDELAEEIE
jgi:phage-related protein (TIGR01555 family)